MSFSPLLRRVDALYARWNALERPAKVAVAVIGALYATVVLAGIYYGPKRYFEFLVSAAQWLASHSWGPLFSMSLIVIASFPPLPGFSMSVTLCGLAFSSNATQAAQPDRGPSNFWYGASLAIAASVTGACLAFMVIRWALDRVASSEEQDLLPNHRHPPMAGPISRRSRSSWFAATLRPLDQVREDKRCRAMDRAIRERGLPMLILIRLCPISYGYFNLFFAAMPSVRLVPFALATLLASPRLLLYVYSGKILYELMDSNADKPTGVKWLEGASAVGGVLLAGGLGYYLMAQVNRILEQEEGEVRPLEADGQQNDGGLSLYDLEPPPRVPPRPTYLPRPSTHRQRTAHMAWLTEHTTVQPDEAAEPLLVGATSSPLSRTSSLGSA